MPLLKRKTPKHSYSGNKWTTILTNKKYLATDFDNRCAYCDDADRFNGGKRNYQVDHFAPESKFPELKFIYENLMYSCPYCNRAKWDVWVGPDDQTAVVDEKGFISPCSNEYYRHLTRNDDGTISSLTPLGEYMRKQLKLYLKRHSILYLLEQVDDRCDVLEKLIAERELSGKDTTRLKIAHSEIATELRKYYRLLCEE